MILHRDPQHNPKILLFQLQPSYPTRIKVKDANKPDTGRLSQSQSYKLFANVKTQRAVLARILSISNTKAGPSYA